MISTATLSQDETGNHQIYYLLYINDLVSLPFQWKMALRLPPPPSGCLWAEMEDSWLSTNLHAHNVRGKGRKPKLPAEISTRRVCVFDAGILIFLLPFLRIIEVFLNLIPIEWKSSLIFVGPFSYLDTTTPSFQRVFLWTPKVCFCVENTRCQINCKTSSLSIPSLFLTSLAAMPLHALFSPPVFVRTHITHLCAHTDHHSLLLRAVTLQRWLHAKSLP